MGVAIWLFLYLLDRANWEAGIIESYTDQEAAEALGTGVTSIRYWRKKLDYGGYITCNQGFRCQKITIHKWRNPRKKDAESENMVIKDYDHDQNMVIKDYDHDQNMVITQKYYHHELSNHGDNNGDNPTNTITYSQINRLKHTTTDIDILSSSNANHGDKKPTTMIKQPKRTDDQLVTFRRLRSLKILEDHAWDMISEYTLEQINDQLDAYFYLVEQGSKRMTVGYFVTALRDGYDMPKGFIRDRDRCGECGQATWAHDEQCSINRRKYTTGKYADYVEA